MKHLDIKYNFIRDVIANGEVYIEYMQTNDQVADIMTKGLGRNLFQKHRESLNLVKQFNLIIIFNVEKHIHFFILSAITYKHSDIMKLRGGVKV